ncbi:alpha/beta-hydrolase [Neolentinus lepideus HHB14362 ss-1]|uniref:Carboxylic ester hydrolase n=1 Tax=Neolentinus lepideus HHB14362 ss-1 TaxID=1314782 RepID=A0A165QEB7_9AGAM|nr:alpha/beta-hydrolase [Neolentinus lepideus HHB14362 ss-1]
MWGLTLRSLVGLLLYGSRLAFAITTETVGNVVDTGYASYKGNVSYPNTVAYLGIPYAEPPLGELRFRAPLPLNVTRVAAAANGQVIDSTTYPNFCIQGTTGVGDAGGAGSEDCLKVNIYTPYGASKGSNLPVLVYIHGGGYVYGNPANWPFDDWINQFPNVVIVSVYYRLDSFGFLAHPELLSGTVGDLNAGFQDQIQALKWINQYIDMFGGDPTQVTINGQSAGGSSVELHLVANEGSTPLFHGAIAQSVFRTPVALPEQEIPAFEYYASYAGCGPDTVAEQMACLRNASVSALARAQDATNYNFTGSLYNAFHPIIDGKIILDYPTRSVLRGEFKQVPLIVGATSNETLSGGSDILTALTTYFPSLTEYDLEGYTVIYPASQYPSSNEQFRDTTGESDVRCARTILGTALSVFNNTWTYRYNQPNPTQINDTAVEHASENWMMFRGTNTGYNGTTTFTPQTPVELAFTSELFAYWLSFVRSGDPNTYKLDRSPEWPQYSFASRNRIVLQQDPQNTTTNSGNYAEPEPDAESLRCAFVASKVDHQQA